jgi:hypothetical protein
MILADLSLKDDGPENSLGLPLSEIIDSHFADFHGPIALGVPCGHTKFQLTIPLGCDARLRVGDDGMSLPFGNLWDRNQKRSGRAAESRPSTISEKIANRFRSYLGRRS